MATSFGKRVQSANDNSTEGTNVITGAINAASDAMQHAASVVQNKAYDTDDMIAKRAQAYLQSIGDMTIDIILDNLKKWASQNNIDQNALSDIIPRIEELRKYETANAGASSDNSESYLAEVADYLSKFPRLDPRMLPAVPNNDMFRKYFRIFHDILEKHKTGGGAVYKTEYAIYRTLEVVICEDYLSQVGYIQGARRSAQDAIDNDKSISSKLADKLRYALKKVEAACLILQTSGGDKTQVGMILCEMPRDFWDSLR